MTETWTVTVLDREDAPLRPLRGVRDGSLDWSIHKQVRGGGSLTLDRLDREIDWLNHRLRVAWSDGHDTRYLGVFLPTTPHWEHTPTGTGATVTLVDKTDLLRSQLGSWWQVPAGQTVLPTVADIIRSRGEQTLALTDSPATLRHTLTWDPDATWLTVANDLLSAAGYGPLWCDGHGWFRAEPYRDPASRPLAAVYGGQPTDYRMLPTFGEEADLSDIPNVVVAVSQGDSERHGLRGIARNTDPSSPLSIPSRGREITRTVTGLEAASQVVIDAHARRLLAESMEVTRRCTWTHPMDDTELDARVELRPLGLSGTVTQRKIRLGIGAVVTDTCRHIYTGGHLWPI